MTWTLTWMLVAPLFIQSLTASAQVSSPALTAPTEARKPLVVATRHVPPFAMKDEEGNWTGISIDLLREIILQLNEDSQRHLWIADLHL